MIFNRMMTRTILKKVFSRKSNDKVYLNTKNTNMYFNMWYMWGIFRFWTCGDPLVLLKVTGWSAASLKLTFHPKLCKLSKIQIKVHFQVVWFVFLKFPKN